MGHLDRRGSFSSLLKMDVMTWLSLILLGVIALTTPALSSEPRVVCYYTNWSVYRPGTARFNPQNINPYLCTHLIYAFGGFTKDNTFKPFDKYQDIEKGGFAKFTGLKTYNKNLKTLLAIGGWNEGSTRFSPMVASREKRKEFVRNAIKFLRQNRFDGLDLDWEYPAFRDGGKPKDRENYARLVKELREEFNRESEKTGKPRLLLTMAVPAGIEYIQKGFDVKTLNQYLDWMNLLTYDYHSAFEPAVNHHAPLYPLEEPNEYSVDSELNIDYTIKFYLENGADPDKLVLGIPTYGRSYTLFNADAVEIGSPADGPGEQGDATREKGYLAYYEICEALKPKTTNKKKRSVSDEDSEEYEDEEEEEEEDKEWTVMHPNPDAMGPVAFRGNQWVGYDDIDIVKKKGEYVAENGLGGIMFWSIDNDDFRGNCHEKPYPLIEAAKEAYIGKLGSTTNSIATRTSKPVSRPSGSNRRRNRPKAASSTTEKPSAKTNKRKSSASSTTPKWNVTPEPPTTPDPGSDFKCVDEGFFQHPRDCKKYFWCLDSGPSNLGIVAHQFTCPSGLFFNKAADSCDFSRNVHCKIPAATTKAPTTKQATTVTTTTTTTTKKPVRLSTKSSALFRTSSTTAAPESEEYEDDISGNISDDDAEDPRVIKELIDLIKKVGGVEQLEKQLHLSEASATTGGTTTPIPFNKKLYKKVLERARGTNKFTGNSILQTAQNSRRGPQSQGLDAGDKNSLLKKDRPQYTTINRQRAVAASPEPQSSEEDEEPEEPVVQSRARVVESQARESQTRVGSTSKPLQYVNIRRARPTTTSDTADDTASRNALFERSEPYVTVPEANTLDIQSARKENGPEYVTIRRQRPTTEETTTIQYQGPAQEVEQETALEREISSQPQYTSIVRTRGTTVSVSEEPSSSEPSFIRPRYTQAPPEELSTPEPTTVLAVQISSLLNSPSSDEEAIETTVAQTTEAEPTTITTTTSTTTTSRPTTTTTTATTITTAAPPSTPTRRTLLRRRGSTTTTTTTTPTPGISTSTTQVSERNYTFVRRRRPLQTRNEISDSDNDLEISRKIRSTTPDSREVDAIISDRETGQSKRFRSRFQSTQSEDSVAAAAVSRGQFRPRLSPDEVVSLTPVEVEPQFVPRQSFSPRTQRQFRGRTTVAEAIADSEASAATVETRRPILLPRGRNRFTVSSSTDAATASPSTDATPTQRRPTFARFSPRPFGRTTASTSTLLDAEDNNQAATETTQRTPTRLSFGRPRPAFSTASPGIQARRLPFPSRVLTTPQSLVSEIDDDDEVEGKIDDISLSESAIEEKEHLEEEIEDEVDEAPKRRIIVKKLRAPIAIEESPTEAIPIDDSGKRRFKIIRRRPATTTTEATISTEAPVSQTNRVRKVIRKKINRIVEEDSDIISKSIGSLETFKVTTTIAPTTEPIINYGEKRRSSTTSAPTTTPSTTTTPEPTTDKIIEEVTEAVKVEVLRDLIVQEETVNNDEGDESDTEVEIKEKEILLKETEDKETEDKETTNENKEVGEVSTTVNTTVETDLKPEVVIETEQRAIDLSEAKEPTNEEAITTVAIETSPETTTVSTTIFTSPTPRARLPFRSQKRLFTSTTESAPSSSRSFSRKYNPGVYTSPASVPTRAPIAFRPSIGRRPPLFTRRPFTTARTTTRLEEEEAEYSDEEILDEEPENPFVLVPSSQLFTRKPDDNEEDVEGEDEESEEIFEDGNENDPEEEEPQQRITSTTRRPYRPRLINSNTFRTSTSTTELPKRFGVSQNRTNVYNRFSSNKSANDTKKRVVNVPVGYNSSVVTLTSKIPVFINETQEIDNIKTTTSISVTETETTTDNDYLEITESTSTLSDNTDTQSTNTEETETATSQMENSTDDYLEFTEQTTYYPSTQDDITNARTVYFQNTASNTETTTEIASQTTTNAPVPPVIKTQFDKLFSVSRKVEVSSKLDKHRVNKNNETTHIEEGQVMIEKKPVVDKIGEVSRFSFIKIVEDDIPIYLTKLGHVYPVENPPDNLIRIDEARNARALNYVEPPRENLVASESVNEAYRHVKIVTDLSKDEMAKSQVEHVTGDDFLSYINVEKSDKTHEEPLFTQWQFVPAAYENDKNKASLKSFEIVTPRSMLTNPSTLSLEGLFKTEMPIMARKVSNDRNQPFLVYSASVPTQKEDANIVKLDVLKPEGRSISTFAKGQELNGGSLEETTVKSPIRVSIVPNTESSIASTTTTTTTSTTETIPTSPIVEMLRNEQSTITESITMSTTEETTTTETVPDETTTVKLTPVELRRAKYGGFPRRPIIKTGNLTRINVPRTVQKKSNSTLSANLFQKSNKTVSFSPNKSRFSVSRSQNVPVDTRKKITSKTPKVFTTEGPRTTTERKLYYKPSRPTFRPAFIPRRTTLPPATVDS